MHIDATITLFDDGKCRWIVHEEQLNGWQLRKRVLQVPTKATQEHSSRILLALYWRFGLWRFANGFKEYAMGKRIAWAVG